MRNIGAFAFSGCSSLNSIGIPDSVGSIGEFAFSDCSSLTELALGTNVTSWGGYAFYGCTGVTQAVVNCSIDWWPDCVFAYCSNLERVVIGDAVTGLDFNLYAIPFHGCPKIKTLEVGKGIRTIPTNWFTGKWNSDAANAAAKSLENLVLSEGLERIENWAFEGCGNLRELHLPQTVTYIGDYAFSDCSSLTDLALGTNVTSWGDCAFSGCAGVTQAVVNCSIDWWPDHVFAYCSNLETVVIGDAVTGLNFNEGNIPFSGCPKIKTLEVGKGIRTIPTNWFMGDWYSDAANAAAKSLENLVLSEGLESIEYGAFEGCGNLRELNLPQTVTNIGDYAFSDCSSLTELALGTNVTSWGDWAFSGCAGVTQAVVNCSIDWWPIGVFSYCNNLETLVIGDAVTGLDFDSSGTNPFTGCPIIKTVEVGKGIRTIPANWFSGKWYSDAANAAAKSLENLVLSEGLESIEYGAFEGCSNLRELNLPQTLTSIGDYAFSDCWSLERVLFAGNAPTAGSDIYEGTPEGLTSWVKQGSTGWDGTDGSVALPETWRERAIRRWGTAEYAEAGEPVPEERTETGAVPLTWLDEYDLARDGDYEGAADGTAANGQPVWKCHLAGLDPTDPKAEFRVCLALEDGKLKVTFSPDLNEGGTKAVRVYRVKGKKKAGEGTWKDLTGVEDYDAEGWRFFRAYVELPAEELPE